MHFLLPSKANTLESNCKWSSKNIQQLKMLRIQPNMLTILCHLLFAVTQQLSLNNMLDKQILLSCTTAVAHNQILNKTQWKQLNLKVTAKMNKNPVGWNSGFWDILRLESHVSVIFNTYITAPYVLPKVLIKMFFLKVN